MLAKILRPAVAAAAPLAMTPSRTTTSTTPRRDVMSPLAATTASGFSPSRVCLQSAKAFAGAGSGAQPQSLAARKRHGARSSTSASSAAANAPTTRDVANDGVGESAALDKSKRNATSVLAGPYRRVGNVFIVTCEDHPFKHGWEVNRMLRDLRLEFMGQTAIHPDLPEVRKRLWRVRHIVRVDILDLDEAKELAGIPAHMNFSDLAAQIPASFGRGGSAPNPGLRSRARFMRLRRMRLRDVMHRDALEKRLLEEKRKMLMATTTTTATATANSSGDKKEAKAAE